MNFLTELVNEGFGWEEKDGGLVMYTTNKGKRILSILLLCTLCVTGIIADSGLQKIQVKAAQETYKVLIWSTVIRDTDGFYQVNFEALVDKYAVQLQSEEAAIDVTLKYSYSQLRPEHFDGTETLADDYDLIWVYLPYMTPNENDIKVLKEYVAAGGRIVLQGENVKNFSKEDANLTDLAESLGASFAIDPD